MGEAGKAVFLSYASQDATAVARIAEALRAAGVEVWFDQNELVGGDAWDKKIRQQIRECAIFVPVISANTQARAEGYFRLEWLLAVERSRLMSDDHPFLFPVVIDDTTDAGARVPDRFRDVQWTRLNVKDTPESLAARVAKVLGRASTTETARGAQPTGRAPAERRFGDPWMRRVGVTFALLIGLTYAVRPLFNFGGTREKPPPQAAARPAQSTAPQTEAQQLVEKARKIFDEGDEMNRETYTLAEELLKKAETLDVTEGSAWALHAQVSAQSYLYGLDNSPTRREAMLMESARATKLMPDSLDAVLASANVRLASRQEIPALEESFKKLAEANPKDPQVLRVLVRAYGLDGKADDASDTARRALRLAPDDPRLKADLVNYLRINNRFAEAEAALTEAKNGRMNARLWAFDSWLRLLWQGDSAGASASIRSWPSWFFLEDRGAALAAVVFLWNHEPAKAIEVLGNFPRDEIEDTMAAGPRAAFTAMAREQLGQNESVRADWRVALQVADRKLSTAPDDSVALHWKAWALARLGDRPAAGGIFNQLREKSPILPSSLYLFGGLASLAETMGQGAEVINYLQPSRFNVTRFERPLTKGILRLNPVFDPLRGDPRFQALVDAAPGPEEKKESKLISAAGEIPAATDKSVAVLAFANLSDDKTNEFFSEGVSEELLIALGKVPGLKVAGRTSAFSFKGRNTTAQEIGRVLGVAYLVDGTVRKSGNDVRVVAHLDRTDTGEQLWTERFSGTLDKPWELQEQIASRVAVALQLKLGRETRASRSVNPEAYALVLEGRHYANFRTEESFNRAAADFQKALQLDANLAEAQASLAAVELQRINYQQAQGLHLKADFGVVEGLTRKAIELEPGLAEPHAVLGYMFNLQGRWSDAAREFEEAVRLNPSSAQALSWQAYFECNRGRIDVALSIFDRATDLEPLWLPNLFSHSFILNHVGRFAPALAQADRALALRPTDEILMACQILRAKALLGLGRRVEALESARAIAKDTTKYRPGVFSAELPALFRSAGAANEATELAERELTRLPGDNFIRGFVLASVGRFDEALPSLALTPPRSLNELLLNAMLDPIRNDPRFQQLLLKLGCVEEHKAAQAAVARLRKQSAPTQ